MIPTHWKIRIAIGTAVIHCASSTEPVAHFDGCGQIESVDWTPITSGQDLGDTLAFIRWNEVSALSWREAKHPESKSKKWAVGEILTGEFFTKEEFIAKFASTLGRTLEQAEQHFQGMTAKGLVKHLHGNTYTYKEA